MAKKDTTRLNGVVIEALPNTMFRVEMTKYDKERGRIVQKFRT
jgi:translation initiation factor IF-1